MKAWRRQVGAIGSSRYSFTVDTPKNNAFVKRFHDCTACTPTMFDGENYEAWSGWPGDHQPASTTTSKGHRRLEDSAYEARGPVFNAQADHKACAGSRGGGEGPEYRTPIPKIWPLHRDHGRRSAD